MNFIVHFNNGTKTAFNAWLIEANNKKLVVHCDKDVFYFDMNEMTAFGVRREIKK